MSVEWKIWRINPIINDFNENFSLLISLNWLADYQIVIFFVFPPSSIYLYIYFINLFKTLIFIVPQRQNYYDYARKNLICLLSQQCEAMEEVEIELMSLLKLI